MKSKLLAYLWAVALGLGIVSATWAYQDGTRSGGQAGTDGKVSTQIPPGDTTETTAKKAKKTKKTKKAKKTKTDAGGQAGTEGAIPIK